MNLFRSALVVSIVAFVFMYLLPEIGYPPPGTEMAHMQSNFDGHGALLATSWTIYVMSFVLGLVVPLACFFCVPWSRELFVALQVFSFGMAMLCGMRVLAPVDVALSHVIALVDGAIIAMMYLSPPVVERFERS